MLAQAAQHGLASRLTSRPAAAAAAELLRLPLGCRMTGRASCGWVTWRAWSTANTSPGSNRSSEQGAYATAEADSIGNTHLAPTRPLVDCQSACATVSVCRTSTLHMLGGAVACTLTPPSQPSLRQPQGCLCACPQVRLPTAALEIRDPRPVSKVAAELDALNVSWRLSHWRWLGLCLERGMSCVLCMAEAGTTAPMLQLT